MSIQSLLGRACDANGVVGVGLGVGTDFRNSLTKCIPVPTNVALVTTFHSAWRAAAWAIKKIEKTDELEKFQRHMVLASYLHGWVAATNVSSKKKPSTFVELGRIAFDAEVHLFDEEVENIEEPLTDSEARAMIDYDASVFQQTVSIIVAAKLTWHATRHHLGTTAANNKSQRVNVGYLDKYVRSVPNIGISMGSATNRSAIHEIVHPPSTIAVLASVFEPIAVKKLVTVMPVAGGCLVPISVAGDVKKRARGGGAGTRKLVDCVAALRKIAVTPLWRYCPARAFVSEILAMHKLIEEDPFSYGDNAAYLTSRQISCEIASLELVLAICHSFVRVTMPGGTLAEAAVFMGDPSGDSLHDPNWHSICLKYKSAIMDLSNVKDEALDAAIKEASPSAGTKMTAAEHKAFEAAGILLPKDLVESPSE